MSDADRLREAARVLRERAEAATPGPWTTDRFFWKIGSTRGMPDGFWNAVDGAGEVHGALVIAGGDEAGERDVAYIATISPPFALAVADWLDEAADHMEAHDHADAPGVDLCPSAAEGPACSMFTQALAVADAVLGVDR